MKKVKYGLLLMISSVFLYQGVAGASLIVRPLRVNNIPKSKSFYQKAALSCASKLMEDGKGARKGIMFSGRLLEAMKGENGDDKNTLKKLYSNCKKFRKKHDKTQKYRVGEILRDIEKRDVFDKAVNNVLRSFAFPRYKCRSVMLSAKLGFFLGLGVGTETGVCSGRNGVTRLLLTPTYSVGIGGGAVVSAGYIEYDEVNFNTALRGDIAVLLGGSFFDEVRDDGIEEEYFLSAGLGFSYSVRNRIIKRGMRIRFNHKKILEKLLRE